MRGLRLILPLAMLSLAHCSGSAKRSGGEIYAPELNTAEPKDEPEIEAEPAKSCTSKISSLGLPGAKLGTPQQNSTTTVTYGIEGNVIRIKSMVVTVENAWAQDKNDVDVYSKLNAGSKERAILNSGDVLPDGQPSPVSIPPNLTIEIGGSLRIKTNWDAPNANDPSASCTIAF